MSLEIRRFAVFLYRRLLFFAVALACLACSAQTPTSADLNRSIQKQIRSTFHIPAQIPINIGQRKPSEFAGYDTITVNFGASEKSKPYDFLISKDNKTLVQMTKMDLTVDPNAELMKKIDLSGRPFRGAKDAKVTVVVYDDFECPFCSRMHEELFQDVMKEYGDRVKVYYKDFPLFEIHPWAGRAAVNAGCLAQQSGGAFWDFADTVHYNPRQIIGDKRPLQGQVAELDRITMELGHKHDVDMTKLAQCVKAQDQTALQASVKEATALGVEGTPALFINGIKLDGAVPVTELRATLDQALRDAGEKVPDSSTAGN
ncbi:MAG: thioredoxin domain-containing protein [Terriglobia bacterium]|jgi:protein-disulfide isomerase|nr:thioredoxin domain-containing protein [Terriglobia bacterium]